MTFHRPAAWTTWLSLFLVLGFLGGCSSQKQGFYDWAMAQERDRAGLTVERMDVDGKSVSVLDSDPTGAADKPVIVMLHGFGASKENWVRFSGYLTAHFRVIAPDLPGHGESVKDLNLRYDLDDQVAFVDALMTAKGISRFHIAGNSMGGAISALYTARHPERVMSLTLFNPAGIYDHESELARQIAQGKNPLIVQNEEEFDALLDFAMEEPPFIPWPITEVLAQRAIANKPVNDKIFADLRAEQHGYDFKGEIATISVPTLIVWGRHDRVLAVENADVFAALIGGSRKVIYENLGHVPMIEDPEASAELISGFIAETPAN